MGRALCSLKGPGRLGKPLHHVKGLSFQSLCMKIKSSAHAHLQADLLVSATF